MFDLFDLFANEEEDTSHIFCWHLENKGNKNNSTNSNN